MITLMLLGNLPQLSAVFCPLGKPLAVHFLRHSAQKISCEYEHKAGTTETKTDVSLLHRCCWLSLLLQQMGTRMRRALWSIGWDSMSRRQSQAQSSCMPVWYQTEFFEAS